MIGLVCVGGLLLAFLALWFLFWILARCYETAIEINNQGRTTFPTDPSIEAPFLIDPRLEKPYSQHMEREEEK